MAARVTQSIVFVGTLQVGHSRVTQSILILGVGLGISCGNPPAGVIGSAYSQTFPTGGGTPPLTFALISGSFPPGLTLNSATGMLSGTPTSPGSFTFTVQVTDAMSSTASVTCSIQIQTGRPFLATVAHRCKTDTIDPSRLTSHDWSKIVPIIEAVRPKPLPETQPDTCDGVTEWRRR